MQETEWGDSVVGLLRKEFSQSVRKNDNKELKIVILHIGMVLLSR